MADFNLPDYPQPFGSRKIWIGTHQGPANYQTGGEVVTVSPIFGGGVFDDVKAGLSFNGSNNGYYTVRAIFPSAQAPAVSANNVKGTIPTGSNNVTLVWVVTSTGSEAANNSNLAAEFARVQYYGG